MTTRQIVVVTAAYAGVLTVTIYLTRASWRRARGAAIGAVGAAALGIGAMLLGQTLGFWWVWLPESPTVWALFSSGLAVSLSPIYLVTWRIARRFGGRGLFACLVVSAIVGPPRDYLWVSLYPEWMVFGRGVVPVLADAAAYVSMVAAGHALMWLVSGPSAGSPLARQRTR